MVKWLLFCKDWRDRFPSFGPFLVSRAGPHVCMRSAEAHGSGRKAVSTPSVTVLALAFIRGCVTLLVSLSVIPGLIFFASPITFCFGPSVYPSSLLQALCRVCHITRACVCMYMHAEGLGEDSC